MRIKNLLTVIMALLTTTCAVVLSGCGATPDGLPPADGPATGDLRGESDVEHPPASDINTQQPPSDGAIYFGGYPGGSPAEASPLIQLQYVEESFFNYTFQVDGDTMSAVASPGKASLTYSFVIDKQPVTIRDIEKKWVNYSGYPSDIMIFKGDISMDAIYRITAIHSGEGGYASSDGAYVATNIKGDEDSATIQRFSNISVNGRTLSATMTLPQEPRIRLPD